MKNILFISPRNPFSGRYSGDVIRAHKFINFLKKKNKVEVVSLGLENKINVSKNFTRRTFKKDFFFIIFIRLFFSIIKLQPLHFTYFHSYNLKRYIIKNYKNFDLIFCQSIRSFQFLPKDINKKIALDMGDLYSKNYYQTYRNLFLLNPLKLVYLIESLLVKKYENFCFSKSHKIYLFSKKEIKSIKEKFRKKISQINFGLDKSIRKFRFKESNYKIIFIGNIKYTPNRQACLNFIKQILPKLKKKFPKIEFHIIGEIGFFDRNLFMKKSGVKIFGKKKRIEPYLSNVICGIANLKISTGIQTKLLTYMSYAIPAIGSKQVIENFDQIDNGSLPYYQNDQKLIDLIIKFKTNKKFSENKSRVLFKMSKKFKWVEVLKILNRI